MLLLLLVFVGLCLSSILWYINDKKDRHVVGWFAFPFVGNAVQSLYFLARGETRMFSLTKMFKEFSPKETVILYLPATTFVCTSNPDNIRYITTDNFANYKREDPSKNFFWRALRSLLGQGIFLADDDIWRLQRSVASPMFKNLSSMEVVFREKSEIVCQILQNHLPQGSTQGAPIDLQTLFMQYTLDSFGKIGFGMEIDSLTDPTVLFPGHFDQAQRLISEFLLNPILQVTHSKSYFDSIKFIDDFIYEKIYTHQEGDDLMSQFMSLKNSEGKPYPAKWIRDILINFAIAGRDTTALLLTWAAYAVAKYPGELQKLRKEILDVLGPHGRPDEASLKKMKYLDCFIKEVLRLYPSVPQTNRVVFQDDVLPDGTKVKKGDRIGYFQYVLHRNPNYWDQAEEFIPERWTTDAVRKHPFQYVPFHAGPTQCLGRHMAQVEAKILFVVMLQRFEWTMVPGQKIEPFLGLVMPAIDGIFVTVQKANL